MTQPTDQRDLIRDMMNSAHRRLIAGVDPNGRELDHEDIEIYETLAWTAGEMLTWDKPITVEQLRERTRMKRWERQRRMEREGKSG